MKIPYQSWFEGTKLRCSPQHQGNPIVDGRMMLGLRAGPQVHPINLLHEMAHLVEIDEARCTCHGWGLDIARVCIPGFAPCIDPRTFQAPAREIRVAAIQRVLARAAKVPFGDYYAAKLIWDWVPGSCYVTREFPELPGYDEQIEYRALVKMFCLRIAQAIVDESTKWTLDHVREEWDRKCKIHEERMS